MRATSLTIGLILACVPGVGCESFKNSLSRPVPSAAGGPLESQEPARFVAYLNRQARQLQSVRYDDVSLKVSAPGQLIPRLRDGTIACSQPRNFRMMSGMAIGGTQLDLGSNPNEFWMYVKQTDTFVYCSYDDYGRGKAQLPVPFEPEWVLEALGMMAYDESVPYAIDVDQKNRLYSLSFDARTPQGEPVRKVVVFAGDPAAGDRPQVVKHQVLDMNRKEIATATVKEVKTVATESGAVQVPTHMILEWPQQKFVMDLSLGQVKVNPVMTEKEQSYFFMRPEIQGATPINLATAPAQMFRPSSYRGSTPSGSRSRPFGGR